MKNNATVSRLISRYALLPTQPLVKVVQEKTDALVVVRVQFQQL